VRSCLSFRRRTDQISSSSLLILRWGLIAELRLQTEVVEEEEEEEEEEDEELAEMVKVASTE